MGARESFLSGDRPDDVALYLSDSFLDTDSLADHGERVDDGVVLVVPGDRGRELVQRLTGRDAMAFAREAGARESHVSRELTGGDCPAGDGPDHEVQFVFAFAEKQNAEVGGIYEAGDVVHAYAYCDCGTAFSDRWVVGDGAD